MPLHWPHVSRREFLGQAGGVAASVLVWRQGWAEDSRADPHSLALLADTHVPSDPATTARDVNMTNNLRQSLAEVMAHTPKVSGVVVNGDCAYLKGLPGDYQNLAQVVQPLVEANLPLHLTMGNHDNREALYAALSQQQPAAPPVEAKHVSVLETPKANWFLLDSLTKTDVVTGELGAAQLQWLAQALDARADKPALLVAHHNPQFEPAANGDWGGLKDARALFDLVAPRRQVKAYIFGHTHDWRLTKLGDVHLVNLPPVAYVFQAGRPNGWVHAMVQDGGLRLRLHCLDKAHALHQQTVELTWA
jgi:3',5'-cyclic AMP phosphodiesterase CpdA